MAINGSALWASLDGAEVSFARRLNRATKHARVGRFFVGVSRLGDGPLWYALILSLPLSLGRPGLLPALQMALTSLTGVLLYRWMKDSAVRERPFITFDGEIDCLCAPLDRYSFPSGHTLHAVSMAILISAHFPLWGPAAFAFAALVALSRVVLGLHYPSDVFVGAALGLVLAKSSLWLATIA